MAGLNLDPRPLTGREDGRTMQEILVVIVIIGVLAAIAVTGWLAVRNSSVDSTVKADVSSISILAGTHKSENGKPPSSITELNTAIRTHKYGVPRKEFTRIEGNTFKLVSDGQDVLCVLAYNTEGGTYTEASPYSVVVSRNILEEKACTLDVSSGVWE